MKLDRRFLRLLDLHFLGRRIDKALLVYANSVLTNVQIRNANLATLRFAPVKLAVDVNFCSVLACYDHDGSGVWVGFDIRGKRGSRGVSQDETLPVFALRYLQVCICRA